MVFGGVVGSLINPATPQHAHPGAGDTSGAEAIDGLACRDVQGWRVQPLETPARSAGGEDRYLPAASAVSPVIRSVIDGEPLDAAAERAAHDAGWIAR
jgi:hypothetical protein